MNPFQKTLFLSLFCFALTACGGTGGSASAAPAQLTTPVASDGLGGTPGQPFAQRLAQTEHPKSLVNDPEAMKRILGEDKDNNGIRDDVDAFIATLTTDPVELKAFQQYARGIQKSFRSVTKTEAAASSDELTAALKCWGNLESVIGNQNERIQKAYQNILRIRKVEKLAINTVERTIRMDEVDKLNHGHTFSFGPDDDRKQWCN